MLGSVRIKGRLSGLFLDRLSRPALMLTVLLMTILGVASPAAASKPTGDYENFGDCPLGNLAVNLCVFAQTTSGEFTVGTAEVPVNKTITLQGGIIATEKAPFTETFVGAADGNTLSKTALTVPGGLLKIVAPSVLPGFLQEILNEFVNKGLLGVTATTELVGSIGINRNNLIEAEGIALTLPVRIHLENPFLGGGCYIGSSSKPVTLNLTTGATSPPPPNESISGSPGEVEFKDEFNLIIVRKNSLVDNSFAAPVAKGCGGIFSFLVDPAVDAETGLPAEAGHNTAILDGLLENATATAVKASEK